MQYMENSAICCEKYVKYINTVRSQNAEVPKFRTGQKYINHWALTG